MKMGREHVKNPTKTEDERKVEKKSTHTHVYKSVAEK